MAENQEKKEGLTLKEILDFFRDVIIIILIVLVIRKFFILPFQISGQSMYESYYDREFIIVDRLSYLDIPLVGQIKKPARGDVVVLNSHIKGKEFFIKRIIGLPGEKLKIQSGSVYVQKVGEKDFIQLDEKYLSPTNYGATYVRGGDDKPYIYEIPKNSYFVMGDNRNASTDSRACFSSCEFGDKTNFLDEKDIVGKIFMDLGYFNFSKFAFTNPNLGNVTTPRFFSSPGHYDY